jgi:hypothetical protein
MSSGEGAVSLVRVRRVPPPGVVAYVDESFDTLIVPFGTPLDAGVVKTLACAQFGWGPQSLVALFLLPDEASARAIQRDPSAAAAMISGEPLFASDAVAPGAWLLARAPPPAAAALAPADGGGALDLTPYNFALAAALAPIAASICRAKP